MASSQSPLKKQLDSLECHFTWKLSECDCSPGLVLKRLEGVRDCGNCAWEGQLYNLMGYYYHFKDDTEEALKCLQKAEAILRQQEAEGRGPRLLVNQANLAWLHFLMGELPESEAYLEKVAELQRDFPAPPGCDLHPEVYGEKGWTEIKLDYNMKIKAIYDFKMALTGDPNRKEWHTGLAQAMYRAHRDNDEFKEKIVEQIGIAKTKDPDNVRISALYLIGLANVGRKTESAVQEAHDLIHQLKPNLDGLEDILSFLRLHDSLDSALRAAEEVVRKHPSERAKLQRAHCYKWKIFDAHERMDLNVVSKGITLYEEVTKFYPNSLEGKLDLASIYVKSRNIVKADEIFKDLLDNTEDLVPEELHLLYNRYGFHLYFNKGSRSESIDYHKKAAEIPYKSRDKKKSIKILRSIHSNHPRYYEIRDFLSNFDLN